MCCLSQSNANAMQPHKHSGLPALGLPSSSSSHLAISTRAALYLRAIFPVHTQVTYDRPFQTLVVIVSAAMPCDNMDVGLSNLDRAAADKLAAQAFSSLGLQHLLIIELEPLADIVVPAFTASCKLKPEAMTLLG